MDRQTQSGHNHLPTRAFPQFQVRLLIDTLNTGWHAEAPYVGVRGCRFYDRDPAGADGVNAVNITLTDENGCNKPPRYYDPFAASRTAGVNGMYMNEQPVDDWMTSNAGGLPPPSTDPMIPGGYLSGEDELGMAYSDVFRMFKFPGTNSVWAKCELRFCFERDDPRCITVRGGC